MEHHLDGFKSENSEGISKIPSSNLSGEVGTLAWGIPHENQASEDVSLFSSSLPVLPHEKLKFAESEFSVQSIDDNLPQLSRLDKKDEDHHLFEDIRTSTIGSLLPDDEEELLAGIIDDFDFSGLPNQVEDLEEYDVFHSGGGIELDLDPQDSLSNDMSKLSLSDGIPSDGVVQYALPNGNVTVAGEHPYGEHPSRTLFVRNINSNVEDSELRSLFEQYGDIRTLYTACKHRGFVMISYYDIRAARTAMRALQNKPLRRRKLDIHFSIPKDNPSEKDINQGTLVVFNLDASVSNDELRQIFGAYGEVKEIRETPHKRHHKFIEFYDIRAAEAALRALNRSEIAGKRIKLEPSRPGGTRRNLMQQQSQELEQDDARTFQHPVGSPVANSPPGNWARFGSPVEQNPLHTFSRSPGVGSLNSVKSNQMPGLASILQSSASSTLNVAGIVQDQGRINVNSIFSNSAPPHGTPCNHSHSLSEQNASLTKKNASPAPFLSLAESNLSPLAVGTLSGPQFLWGSPSISEPAKSSAWPTSVGQGLQFGSNGRVQGQGFLFSNRGSSFLSPHQPLHVGSAPSGISLNRQFGYLSESPKSSFLNSHALGRPGLGYNGGNYMMSMGAHSPLTAGVALHGNIPENSSPSFRMMSFPRHGPTYGSYSGLVETSIEGFTERGQSHRPETSGNQIDIKKQYQLDLERIISGEDSRTTLMIKNIPNKYTSKMLLAAIDELHRGTYDFLYLPIDFKNKCNVGYAFINMIAPLHIIPFYETFNGKKWEKFNSEKVASLAYARIQGKAALVSHFQNSSLMNEDKRCRPIVFHSEGQEMGDQKSLLSANLNICIRQPDGTYSGDSLDSPKGNLDEKPDEN